MRKIAVALTKGGVGKTTTAVNLAAGLANADQRVLLIDVDTQGQAGKMLGCQPTIGLAEFVAGNAHVDQAITQARDRLFLLGGGKSLAGLKMLITRNCKPIIHCKSARRCATAYAYPKRPATGKRSLNTRRIHPARTITWHSPKGSDKMMKRKQTPDILGEILSGTAPAAPPKPIDAPRRSMTKKGAAAGSQWEYLVVSFQDQRGWRARFVNGEEFDDWESGPLIHELLDQLGDDGWELISVNRGNRLYGRTDSIQAYFKRAKR